MHHSGSAETRKRLTQMKPGFMQVKQWSCSFDWDVPLWTCHIVHRSDAQNGPTVQMEYIRSFIAYCIHSKISAYAYIQRGPSDMRFTCYLLDCLWVPTIKRKYKVWYSPLWSFRLWPLDWQKQLRNMNGRNTTLGVFKAYAVSLEILF